MTGIIDTIHADHRNYSVLLSMLNADIDNMNKGEKADFVRLYDIMNYMINYPDVKHHPAEEVIFERLEQKQPEIKEEVAQLVEEHRRLAETGRALQEKLQQVIGGGIVSKESISDAARDYYELLLNHLNFEEGKLLPLVKQSFSDDDWQNIEVRLSEDEDPLFGKAINEQFTNLLQQISAHRNLN